MGPYDTARARPVTSDEHSDINANFPAPGMPGAGELEDAGEVSQYQVDDGAGDAGQDAADCLAYQI